MTFWQEFVPDSAVLLAVVSIVFILIGIKMNSSQIIQAAAFMAWLDAVASLASGVMCQVQGTRFAPGWYTVAFSCAMTAILFHILASRTPKPSG